MLHSRDPDPTDSNVSLSVESYGRIHFGLMEICDGQPHCFGGIGVMIDHSRAIVQAKLQNQSERLSRSFTPESCHIEADQYWLPRIEAIVNAWHTRFGSVPVESLALHSTPVPHCGLGSGTQLACTLVAALLAAHRHSDDAKHTCTFTFATIPKLLESLDADPAFSNLRPIERLSALSQRGKRSNIGLCGFLQGGFVVDRGETIAQRTQHFSFPEQWPILIIQDLTSLGDSGTAESKMFEQCSQSPNPNRSQMLHCIDQEILPALANRDWVQFDHALGTYGRWAGQIFEPVQGGIYRTPQIANAIAEASKLGITGASQSSWGPSICAIARDDDHAKWCEARLRTNLTNARIHATKAINHAARLCLP